MPDDPQTQVDTTITKLAEEYAECDRDSKELSDRRKDIRDRVESLGIHKLAWQHAVGMTKKMTVGERRDYTTSFERVIGVIGDKQMSLFPEQSERLRKRAEKAADSPEAKKQAADAKTDTDPRSDPSKGGAAATATADAAKWAAAAPTGARTPADDAKEQAEGAAALAAAAPALAAATAKPKADPAKAAADKAFSKAETTSKKRAQSDVAKEKLAAAGMN